MKSMQLPMLKYKGRSVKKKKTNHFSGYISAHHKRRFFIPLATILPDSGDQAAASQNKSAFGPLQALKKENKE